MKILKNTIVVIGLCAISLSALAITPIEDNELSQVEGQAGLSILANLNVNVGSVTFTPTSVGAGSMGITNLNVTGSLPFTIDLLQGGADTVSGSFLKTAEGTNSWGITPVASLPTTATANQSITQAEQTTALAKFAPATSSVIALAVPQNLAVTSLNASFGLMANNTTLGAVNINNANLAGTTVLIIPH